MEGVNKYLIKLAEKQIRIAFEQSEKEVADLHQRTKEGIETARLNGKAVGGSANKGKSLTTKKSIAAKKTILEHSKSFHGKLNNLEMMKLCGISEPTLLKYKKEIRTELIEAGKME